jgi:hypothetical protein
MPAPHANLIAALAGVEFPVTDVKLLATEGADHIKVRLWDGRTISRIKTRVRDEVHSSEKKSKAEWRSVG